MATRKNDGATKIVSQPKETPAGEHGPVDETDPTKRVSSVTAIPDEEAVVVGTVDTVAEVPQPEPAPTGQARTEEYEATRPDGSKVTVVRNIETGTSELK